VTWHFNCRLLGLLITLALTLTITEYSYWLALLIGVGFVHYALSFYYASARMRELGSDPDAAVLLLSLAGLFAAVYFLGFSLEVYFGLHHAFNEAYLKRASNADKSGTSTELAPLRCLLHLALYFCILRNDPRLAEFPALLLWIFAGATAVAYVLKLRALSKAKGISVVWSDHSVELGMLAVLLLSFYFRITFFQFVLYHFVIWTLLPIPAMKARGEGHLQQYLLLTAAGLALYFGAITVVAPTQFSATLTVVLSQFYLWSYIHITASMALSSAHPQWLVRLFQRGPAAA
jgi:hypothetical protein